MSTQLYLTPADTWDDNSQPSYQNHSPPAVLLVSDTDGSVPPNCFCCFVLSTSSSCCGVELCWVEPANYSVCAVSGLEWSSNTRLNISNYLNNFVSQVWTFTRYSRAQILTLPIIPDSTFISVVLYYYFILWTTKPNQTVPTNILIFNKAHTCTPSVQLSSEVYLLSVFDFAF